ncbi:hemerythrin domain-containing protein [Paenibacillus sp. N3.4]|uniref:hemerythrin domain-containing protein n=1 Tax=Paenibacillus sp. N3.4 TaxID=2603222 RepID=UPI0021C2E570|nr:hemerythrin domain-containing protein [Paenibacillus sp. N3.4]
MKEEHETLRQHLKGLEMNAKEVVLLKDPSACLVVLEKLKGQTSDFMEELERHSLWEDKELFPFLHNYFHYQPVPSIMPSFWILEKDHMLGVSFIQSFLDALLDIKAVVEKKQLLEVTSFLIQACLILNDHLTMEEQIVYPLTEKVLTDLDSFFS